MQDCRGDDLEVSADFLPPLLLTTFLQNNFTWAEVERSWQYLFSKENKYQNIWLNLNQLISSSRKKSEKFILPQGFWKRWDNILINPFSKNVSLCKKHNKIEVYNLRVKAFNLVLTSFTDS